GAVSGPVTDAFTDRDVQLYKHAFARPGAATAALNYYRALGRHMTWRPLPRVWAAMRSPLTMPALSVMAAKDAALEPYLLRGLEEMSEGGKALVLNDCSHWMPCDRPGEVTQLITAFLDKHAGGSAAPSKM
ncbi:hypothetical protein QJQ45_029613, partial [Haematococcus lacustris]